MEEPLTIEEVCSFTLQSYMKFLGQLKKIYKIIPFCELPQEPPYIILRHDVDVSPLAALKMAWIEHGLGIRSTYFVLFTSEFYNMFDRENIHLIRAISKLGHEIGLHYDPTHLRVNGLKPIEILKMQIRVLESITGKNIRTIVRHGPWSDRDPFAAIKGYINADHPYYLGDLGIHDSLKIWTPLNGLIKLFKERPNRVQILIHPENWTESSINRESTLEQFFKEIYEKYNRLEEEVRKTWLNYHDVFEYNRLMPVLKNSKLCLSRQKPSNEGFIKSLTQNIKYYKKYFTWCFNNSKIGWQINTILENLRKKTTSYE